MLSNNNNNFTYFYCAYKDTNCSKQFIYEYTPIYMYAFIMYIYVFICACTHTQVNNSAILIIQIKEIKN